MNKRPASNIEARLASYVSLIAPEQSPLSCHSKRMPNIIALSSSYRRAPMAPDIRPSSIASFLTSPEYREIKKLFADLTGIGLPPYTMENGDNKAPVEFAHRNSRVFDGRRQKGSYIQRYKGLGEMNPDQLWETTMNPETRVLLQVRIEDAVEADEIFSTLMGDEVEPRRKFIEE